VDLIISQRNKLTQTPLVADHIKFQNMIINLVRICVETTKCIDGIVPAVCEASIDKTRRSLAKSSSDFGSIIRHLTTLDRRIRHEKGIIRGSC
jgi:hypothetical protein